MPGKEDSLFSLELVVEKVYIPHIACRFPSVAFRLLDFPTIVINHVEDDLARSIKAKITRDPYYEVPAQFSELKDKHGNFMIKKGKSCLFKITVDSLKNHLNNTPLYVMLIDTFPEIPKLLGNSTVPLNFIMEEICVDIAKMGTTVPSVHGDKGLFKLYSLMGKEIGYFVLGFRLLCLGPSLIPHLPEGALIKRKSKLTESEKVEKVTGQIIHVKEADDKLSDNEVPALRETKEMGSMTDVEKHDMLIQTLQMDDKAVHVAISTPEERTASTQTEKHKKTSKQKTDRFHNVIQKMDQISEDEEIIVNNFVCPPPLFYNSKSQPHLKIKPIIYQDMSTTEDDLSVDDLESTSEEEIKVNKQNKYDNKGSHDRCVDKNNSKPKSDYTVQSKSFVKGPVNKNNEEFVEKTGQDAIFPILTALLNELSCIQNPQLLQNVTKNVQKLKLQIVQQRSAVSKMNAQESEILVKPLTKSENGKENIPVGKDGPEKKRVRQCAHPPELVSKNKGWLRKVPEFHSPKKTQLAYRLTNTQRLRLAKTNPQWLEMAEKEEAEAKMRKQAASKKNPESDDLDMTNFSDTLTEVRRLAEKELEKKGEKTIDSLNMSSFRSEGRKHHRKHKSKTPRSRSPKSKSHGTQLRSRTPQPKYQREKVKSALSDDSDDGKPHLVPLESESRVIKSPDLYRRPFTQVDNEDTSIRSDLPSSQKSIEVRLPSVQGNEREDSENTMDEEDEVSSDDTRYRQSRHFPGFGKEDRSFPGAISGKPNASLMQSSDYDQPLESTRVSKNFNTNGPSRTLGSTDCYDTHQFHSTEEPELLGLVSAEDHHSEVMDSARQGRNQLSASVDNSAKFPVLNPTASEQSPVPATRRSTVKLDTGRSGSQPGTPASHSAASSKRPTPRPRKPVGKLESIHTESVSSYLPSDPENVVASLSSDVNYSDDFHSIHGQNDSLTDISSPDISMQRFIPDSKLAYTIN